MTKTDILDTIDAALAENRQVKQRRMQAHVMWLLDNPTQLPITDLSWDESTTEITDQDMDQCAEVAGELWRFGRSGEFNHLCVRCASRQVKNDHPWCNDPRCKPYNLICGNSETMHPACADIADLPQPLHRGRVHVRPMVQAL